MTKHEHRRRKKIFAGAFIVFVGLVAGLVGWQLWPNECGGAFSEFQLNDGDNRECIGITDGSYKFNDPSRAANENDRELITRINALHERVEHENQLVAATDRYVKVVLLMPMTVSESMPSAMSLEQILHSMEGAYTALMRANHSHSFGDPSAAKLQLLLANQGSQLESAPNFIGRIAEESEDEHPVVAVVGLGVSRTNTVEVAEQLAEEGIPMVSAVTSADNLTDLPYFWSVSPSDTQYALALRHVLDHQDTLNSGILVYDQNDDLYTKSLANAYRTELRSYIRYPDQPYRGSTIHSNVAPTVFDPVVRNICNASDRVEDPLNIVFYAGREVDFEAFAKSLEERTCKDRPLAMLVGSTGFANAERYEDVLENTNMTVVNASSSDSLTWSQHPTDDGTPEGFVKFVTAYQEYASGVTDSLADGYAIAHHDALASAAQAIRLAAGNVPTLIPDSHNVASHGFGHLSLAHQVIAASGTLTFPPENGRPTGRRIPIRQINLNTAIQLPANIPPYEVR